MSTDLTKPTRQAAAVAGRSAPLKVTGKLKIAIETMVWSGACRADAAKVSGLTDHSLRSALKKPHVKAAYLAELEVLRLSARARAFHRLVELSEQNDNKGAAVAAVRTMTLEGRDEAQRGFGAVASPGLTIQIISSSDAVKVAPTIEHDEGDCE
ncbi:MAG: hypothetical protein WBL84_13485 [Xanthobacteraceae bacterium]|jgi:hypothetical protein